MGDQHTTGTLSWNMARLTVAVFLVFTAFACASIPEFSDVEPEFVEELVQEQPPTAQAPTAQAPTVDQDKTNMNSQPDQMGDVETFKVVNKKHVAVPPEAGDEGAYRKQKEQEKQLQSVSSTESTTNSEQAAGLNAAAKVMKEQEISNARQAESHNVAEAMNYAAEMAAQYKKKVEAKSKQDMVVQKAKLEVQSQEQVVNNFRAQLRAAEHTLAVKQGHLATEEHKAVRDRYKMEHAGDIYSRAKTKAIRLDNIHKAHLRQERKNKTFEKVAERAVKNFQKKAKNTAEKPATKAAPAKPKTKTHCTNCVHLPKEYAQELGEKGSCADCDKWAKQNYCTIKKYAQFMSDYCAGSCFKKTGKCGHNPQ